MHVMSMCVFLDASDLQLSLRRACGAGALPPLPRLSLQREQSIPVPQPGHVSAAEADRFLLQHRTGV